MNISRDQNRENCPSCERELNNCSCIIFDGHYYEGMMVTWPIELANNIALRRFLTDKVEFGEAQLVDFITFQVGEPKIRSTTKLGGLPYLPANEIWPSTENGHPYTFLGQFNFTSSWDLVDRLPGEILLIFGSALRNDIHPIVYKWIDEGDFELVHSIPENESKLHNNILPCFGTTVRVKNFPLSRTRKTAEKVFLDDIEVRRAWLATNMVGSKIGGSPYSRNTHQKWKYLCTFSSINRYTCPQEKVLNKRFSFSQNLDVFRVGDLGSIDFFLDSSFEIQHRVNLAW